MGEAHHPELDDPCRAAPRCSRRSSTARPPIKLNVLQGEREAAGRQPVQLARFELDAHSADARRLPARIEVEFLIDANGILSVSAT